MFIGWTLSIILFVICIGTTMLIMDALKERDKEDLANSHLQLQNLPDKNKQMTRQIV